MIDDSSWLYDLNSVPGLLTTINNNSDNSDNSDGFRVACVDRERKTPDIIFHLF